MASRARTPAVTGSVISLVSLPAQPSRLLVQPDMGVRVDESGEQPPAGRVDDRGAGRDGDLRAERDDSAVPDAHHPVERITVDRHDVRIDERQIGHGTDSATTVVRA